MLRTAVGWLSAIAGAAIVVASTMSWAARTAGEPSLAASFSHDRSMIFVCGLVIVVIGIRGAVVDPDRTALVPNLVPSVVAFGAAVVQADAVIAQSQRVGTGLAVVSVASVMVVVLGVVDVVMPARHARAVRAR